MNSFPSYLANLAHALAPFGVAPAHIPVAFNCFMNVPVDGATGTFKVEPPLSRAGDRITFEAETDLIIGLTACSALQSNNGSFKPIHYRIDRARRDEPERQDTPEDIAGCNASTLGA